MTDHLHRRSCQGGLAESYVTYTGSSRHTKQHDAHVADAGVGDQPLHIRLHQADTRAIDDINGRDYRYPASELVCSSWQEGQADAAPPLHPHIIQYPTTHHTPPTRPLAI